MPVIHVDTARMRWKATVLGVVLDSMRRAQRDIGDAVAMATGYDGQLRRQVLAIAGHDESLVRVQADELEELIFRLRQITEAFEAVDGLSDSSPAMAYRFSQMIDNGLLLSADPSGYLTANPLSLPEWELHGRRDPRLLRRIIPVLNSRRYLGQFAESPLYPVGGTEADYWKAFEVFLYVSGAISARPTVQTWNTAASASDQELEGYLSLATGIREPWVGSWLQAAETHNFEATDAIHEMVLMSRSGETFESYFGYTTEGDWAEDDQDAIVEGVLMVGYAMAEATPQEDQPHVVFGEVFGDTVFRLKGSGLEEGWYCSAGGYGWQCEPLARGRMSPQLLAHELGHTLNARVNNNLRSGIQALGDYEREQELLDQVGSMTPYYELGHTEIAAEIDGELVHVSGRPPGGGYERTDQGYASLGQPWQQHSIRWDSNGNTANEDFADMFLGWAFEGFSDDPAGSARYTWMEDNMPEWIEQASAPINLDWFDIGEE